MSTRLDPSLAATLNDHILQEVQRRLRERTASPTPAVDRKPLYNIDIPRHLSHWPTDALLSSVENFRIWDLLWYSGSRRVQRSRTCHPSLVVPPLNRIVFFSAAGSESPSPTPPTPDCLTAPLPVPPATTSTLRRSPRHHPWSCALASSDGTRDPVACSEVGNEAAVAGRRLIRWTRKSEARLLLSGVG